MKLKEKTYKKFVEFFEKMSKKNGNNNEFEIAYSEIQRDIGVASITLKKGLQILEDEGIILVSPGRNTRYGRFKYLLDNKNNSGQENSTLIKNRSRIGNKLSRSHRAAKKYAVFA